MMTSGIAAQLYTLRDFMKTPADIATSMKKVKAIGYDAVQLSGLGPIDPKELAAILQGEGLTAAATHIGFNRLRDELPAVIDEHKLWGCQHVAIGSMPDEFRTSGAGYVEFAHAASDIARKLNDAGLTFSYHNHSFEFEKFDGKLGIDLLFDNADPLVKAEIDTYWVQHGGGSPATWLNKLHDRLIIVHFKDMAILGWKQIMAEVGEGNLDWPAIIDACHNANVDWYIVEQDTCQRDPFESLAISRRNLKELGVG